MTPQTQALQLRCNNSKCTSGKVPVLRIYENGTEKYQCSSCFEIEAGPNLLDYVCETCLKGMFDCRCEAEVEYLYGGPLTVCEQCLKQTVIIDMGSGSGFAGGRVYYERYSCGHMDMDESADIAAAY